MNRSAIASSILFLVIGACGGKAKPAGGGGAAPDPGHAAAAPCKADDVAGSWTADKGSDFEEITIEAGGTFATYLHERPFASGTWSLDGATLVLTNDDGTSTRVDGASCATGLSGTTGGAAVEWSRIQPGAQ